jgi:hypothetical protein
MENVNISCRITEVILLITCPVSMTSPINMLCYRDVVFIWRRYRRNAGGFDKHFRVPTGTTINAVFLTGMCSSKRKRWGVHVTLRLPSETWAGVATSYGLDGPGIESRRGSDFSDWLWDSHSLLNNGHWVSSPEILTGAWRWPTNLIQQRG